MGSWSRRTRRRSAWASSPGCTPSRPPRCGSPGSTPSRSRCCHLHTQFNRDIPWSTIDMDFMNLNQSAHGGREFGFIADPPAARRARWSSATGRNRPSHARIGVVDPRRPRLARRAGACKIARFGDNMRQVAVTEGDKVEAQIGFGFSVNGYGVGDLVAGVDAGRRDAEVDALSPSTTTRTKSRRSCGRRATPRVAARRGPRSSSACAASCRGRASTPSPTRSRTCTA